MPSALWQTQRRGVYAVRRENLATLPIDDKPVQLDRASNTKFPRAKRICLESNLPIPRIEATPPLATPSGFIGRWIPECSLFSTQVEFSSRRDQPLQPILRTSLGCRCATGWLSNQRHTRLNASRTGAVRATAVSESGIATSRAIATMHRMRVLLFNVMSHATMERYG